MFNTHKINDLNTRVNNLVDNVVWKHELEEIKNQLGYKPLRLKFRGDYEPLEPSYSVSEKLDMLFEYLDVEIQKPKRIEAKLVKRKKKCT